MRLHPGLARALDATGFAAEMRAEWVADDTK